MEGSIGGPLEDPIGRPQWRALLQGPMEGPIAGSYGGPHWKSLWITCQHLIFGPKLDGSPIRNETEKPKGTHDAQRYWPCHEEEAGCKVRTASGATPLVGAMIFFLDSLFLTASCSLPVHTTAHPAPRKYPGSVPCGANTGSRVRLKQGPG